MYISFRRLFLIPALAAGLLSPVCSQAELLHVTTGNTSLLLDRIDNSPLAFEGKSFTGRYLMDNGLEMPLEHDVDYHKRRDYASRVLRLQAR